MFFHKIKQMLQIAFFSLLSVSSAFAVPYWEDAELKVRLEWSSGDVPVDLDLSIQAPSGTKLYYANKDTDWGFFSKDDRGYKNGASYEEVYFDLYDAEVSGSGRYNFLVSHYSGPAVTATLSYWMGGVYQGKFTYTFNPGDRNVNFVYFDSTKLPAPVNSSKYEINLADGRRYDAIIPMDFSQYGDVNLLITDSVRNNWGLNEVISYIKYASISNNTKASSLVLAFHGNEQLVRFGYNSGKEEVFGYGVVSGGVLNNRMYFNINDRYVRSKFRRLGKYLGKSNGTPTILLFACLIGKNEDFLRVMAEETNAIVFANSQNTGDSLFGILNKDWSLNVVVWPDGHVSYQ